MKQTVHLRHRAGIPAADVQRVERRTAGKHIAHIRYRAGIPAAHVQRGERRTVLKHTAHIRYRAGIPAADVQRGEGGTTGKHRGHRRYRAGIPAADIQRGERRTTGKHTGHIRYRACVQMIDSIHGGQIGESAKPRRSGYRRNRVQKRNRGHVFPIVAPRHTLLLSISVRQKAGVIFVAGNGIAARCAVDAVRFQPAHAERKGAGGAVKNGVGLQRLPYPRVCHGRAVIDVHQRFGRVRRAFAVLADPLSGMRCICRCVRQTGVNKCSDVPSVGIIIVCLRMTIVKTEARAEFQGEQRVAVVEHAVGVCFFTDNKAA